MAILTSTDATTGFDMLTGDGTLFDTQDSGLNSSTEYSWLTANGTDVQAYGSGITFSGGVPTGGTITSLEFDIGNNDFLDPDFVLSGLSANLVTLANPTGLQSFSTGFAAAALSGNDVLNGSGFDDSLKGGAGNDSILGGDGADNLQGNDGNDTIRGGDKNDSINGGADNDFLYGDAGNDTLDGSSGNDFLTGGFGSNEIDGGTGNDTITEGGNDTVDAGDDDDRVQITSTAISSFDSWDGGDGTDMLDMDAITVNGSEINIFSGVWTNAAGNSTETIANFENLEATQGDDEVISGNEANFIGGNNGDDYIRSFGGNDTVEGNFGADSIETGSGDDLIRVYSNDIAQGNDTIDGGSGYDTLISMSAGSFNYSNFVFAAGNTIEEIEFRGLTGIAGTAMTFTSSQMATGFASDLVIDGNGNAGTLDELIINMNGGNLDMSDWSFTGFNNITGDDAAIVVNGTATGNIIDGSVMTDRLNGNDGNDDFDLQTSTYHLGDDSLFGGNGDDDLFLQDSGTYLLNEGLQINSIERIVFSNSGAATTFNIKAQELDNTTEFSATGTIQGNGAQNILNIDLASDETFDHSGWDVSSFTGADQINYINGDASTSNFTTTDYNDNIDTGNGNATVNSGDGNDTIQTGTGNDSVIGGTGADSLEASAGNDSMAGGVGNDTIKGGGGSDSIAGGADNDVLYDNDNALAVDSNVGIAGNDTLDGGTGDDTLYVIDGNDSIVLSGGGADYVFIDGDTADTLTLVGGSSNDTVDFSSDNVLFTGTSAGITSVGSTFTTGTGMSVDLTFITDIRTGNGNDSIAEGAINTLDMNGGDDTFIGFINANTDFINGGSGIDTYENTSTAASNINLEAGTVNGVAGAVVNFENFEGNSTGGNDTVTAWDGGSDLNGANGNDSLIGGLGNDTLTGGAGNDDSAGGDGDDNLTGGTGNDTMRGNIGQDTLSGQANADELYGGQNEDEVFGGAGFDFLDGGDGADLVDGGGDNDTVNGGNGNDTVLGVAGSDVIDGGSGNDSILGGNGFDTIDGGVGLDTIDAGLGNDVVNAGGANDSVLGNAGSDTINGDGGADTLEGQGGNDVINGGDGSDVILGGVNNDTITGGAGNDTMTGGTGADDFVFSSINDADVITDFLVNVDDLDFSGVAAINSFADFSAAASNVGANVVVGLGGGSQITLLGVQENQFDAADFIF